MKKKLLSGKARIPVSLALALLTCILCASGAFYSLDSQVTDGLYQQKGAASQEIVVIGIDEKATLKLGNPMQWSRSVIAQVIRHLNSDPEYRPAVIGIDVLFTAPSFTDPEGDQELADACAEYGNVILVGRAERGTKVVRDVDSWALVQGFIGWEEPFALLRERAEVAHANGVLDADRIVRHGLLWVTKPDGEKVDSLAWAVYKRYCAYHDIPVGEPAATGSGLFYIRYTAPHRFYEDSYTFLKCLDPEFHTKRLKGKVVLIGGYAPALGDQVYTSLTPQQMMYGVEVQANIVDEFMQGRHFREAGGWVQIAALFLTAFLAACLLWNRRTLPAMLLWLLGSGLWLGICLLLRERGIVVHVLWGPISLTLEFAVIILINYTRAYLARQQISRTFGRYVDPAVFKELLESDAAADLGGKPCRIAVLFVDIRGFTSMSENLPAQTVVEILNRYLALTTDCVMRNHGTLDKFVGDCTMALWGAPVPVEDPVYLACRAAIDMQEEGKRLEEEMKQRFGRTVDFGIGIHYGPAVVGNIGAPMRMDYTAIGDTVNTAARLEANAPGGTILISEDVREQLGNRAKVRLPENEIRLKGKNEQIGIYILDRLEELENK